MHGARQMGLRFRDQREGEKKKPSPSANRGMKAFRDSGGKPFRRLASSFSLTEKCPGVSRSRRAQSNRCPDFGLPTSLPPSRNYQWLLGVCNPSQWRNRRRFSRRSLRLTAIQSDERIHRRSKNCADAYAASRRKPSELCAHGESAVAARVHKGMGFWLEHATLAPCEPWFTPAVLIP